MCALNLLARVSLKVLCSTFATFLQFVQIQTTVVILFRKLFLNTRMIRRQIFSSELIANWSPLTEFIFIQGT